MLRSVLLFVAMLFAAAARATPPSKPPRRAEALQAVKAKLPGTTDVGAVFPDVGGGRYPVLFVVREGDKRQCNGGPAARPHVGLLASGGNGELRLAGELPLGEPDCVGGGHVFVWGETALKDYDGDGKPELLVHWAWHGPQMRLTIYGNTVAIVELDGPAPTLAFSLRLDDDDPMTALALGIPPSRTTWELVAGTPPVIRVVIREWADEHADIHKDQPVTTTTDYIWDAPKRAFVAPRTPGK
jgi:hypothetical protein